MCSSQVLYQTYFSKFRTNTGNVQGNPINPRAVCLPLAGCHHPRTACWGEPRTWGWQDLPGEGGVREIQASLRGSCQQIRRPRSLAPFLSLSFSALFAPSGPSLPQPTCAPSPFFALSHIFYLTSPFPANGRSVTNAIYCCDSSSPALSEGNLQNILRLFRMKRPQKAQQDF